MYQELEIYLKNKGCNSIEELSNDDLMSWAATNCPDIGTKLSAQTVLSGMFGRKPDFLKASKTLRDALKKEKSFYCVYINNESCNGEINENHEYFEMGIE